MKLMGTKFIFTEKQFKKILNEQETSNKFRTECLVNFTHSGVLFKNKEILDIQSERLNVNFDIDIEYKTWGIKSIDIFNIKGPTEIEILVSYMSDEKKDDLQEYTTLKLDWSLVNVDDSDYLSHYGVGDNITIVVGNDENGNLIVNQIIVEANSL